MVKYTYKQNEEEIKMAAKIKSTNREFLSKELLYLYTTLDGKEEEESLNEIEDMTDNEVVREVNNYYEGTGTQYKLK